MKKYRVKENEDLGSIARKYALPSWKYLYELNKEAIGDNPDLLKPGTELKIPLWDSTTGDEKLKEKEIDRAHSRFVAIFIKICLDRAFLLYYISDSN